VRRFVLGSYALGLLLIALLTLMVHNLRTSFDAALDTAGSLQVRFIECEGDRLKLQASLQSCNITETLKLDDEHDTEYRRASARNEYGADKSPMVRGERSHLTCASDLFRCSVNSYP
jgi:hypothetical protein